jgi:hypothetical protein
MGGGMGDVGRRREGGKKLARAEAADGRVKRARKFGNDQDVRQ